MGRGATTIPNLAVAADRKLRSSSRQFASLAPGISQGSPGRCGNPGDGDGRVRRALNATTATITPEERLVSQGREYKLAKATEFGRRDGMFCWERQGGHEEDAGALPRADRGDRYAKADLTL